MSPHDHEVAICEHGLRYDPSRAAGCVICRRDAEHGAVARGPQLPTLEARAFGRVLGGLLAVAALVVLAIYAVPALLESSDRGPAPGRAVQTRSAAHTAPRRDERRAGPPREEAPADALHSPPDAIDPEIGAEANQRRIDPQEDLRAEAEALARARRNVPVIVYTTSWCPSCARAKAFMDSAGIAYTERDIEASENDSYRLGRINPRRTIPTFDVDGEVLTGFSSERLMDAIDRIARRRL